MSIHHIRADSSPDLSGWSNRNALQRNLSVSQLVKESVRRQESRLAANGALVALTGPYTGRSPKDRYIVEDDATRESVDWGDVNLPISPRNFARLHQKVLTYLQSRDVFVQDCFVGADPAYRMPIRVITELAWHSLFARQLFVRPTEQERTSHSPEFTVIYAPGLQANPNDDGTRSEAFVILNFTKKLVLIGGTRYAGEMKKSVFSLLNFLLPARNVFPMHCSANLGQNGDVALFFGLSGTGKTTLSADPQRRLIGDDEHGWSENGVFNFEGGCYAKCIRLSPTKEPEIWNALRFGAVLENVVLDHDTLAPDYDDDSITENTRAAYPVDFIGNAVIPGVAGGPRNIVFLTADAFGVLPPISKLTREQAMYQFLSGYTAKVAGTERGLGNEPSATFSACFGAPFLPRKPGVYAEMLGQKLREHPVDCWLVNTGWIGGVYGVGRRMDLPHTRAMLDAALSGALNDVDYAHHPIFGLSVPKSCPGVPPEVLDARGMWADSTAYDATARNLAARFRDNFGKFSGVSEAVKAAGPQA